MTKVKICGITNLEDALLSAKFGADALGFNFYEKSPRYIAPENVREIIEHLPEKVLKVGVFVNESLDKIVEIAETAKLDALQLHGEETPEFARELKQKTNLEIIKAFRVSPDFAPEYVLKYETDAILLDAYSPKEHGGTGETFDWEIAKKVQEIFPKMYLAGGLSHENVNRAIGEVKPFAVDACSCLELKKGKKDKINLINFICNILYSRLDSEGKRELASDINLVNSLRFTRTFLKFPGRKFYTFPKSVTQLCSFILGYQSALAISLTEFEKNHEFLRGFEEYLGIKRELFENAIYSFAEYFLKLTNGDEERAFDCFNAELEEFLLKKN
jgi:phosphoribosylanthranilate isomerase